MNKIQARDCFTIALKDFQSAEVFTVHDGVICSFLTEEGAHRAVRLVAKKHGLSIKEFGSTNIHVTIKASKSEKMEIVKGAINALSLVEKDVPELHKKETAIGYAKEKLMNLLLEIEANGEMPTTLRPNSSRLTLEETTK